MVERKSDEITSALVSRQDRLEEKVEQVIKGLAENTAQLQYLRDDVRCIRKVLFGNGDSEKALISLQATRELNYRWISAAVGIISGLLGGGVALAFDIILKFNM